jgi:uncharacterized phage-associated protein
LTKKQWRSTGKRAMLDQLIKYFVYGTKGYITKTQLTKFLYLADLYSVKWTGKQLTDLDWCYYQYGPWNEEIDTALKQMNGKEIIQESQGDITLIKLGAEAGNVDDLDLPFSLKLILDNIRREWAGAGQDKLNKLLEYVYSTAPMQEVKNTHQSEDKVKLNLQAERDKLIGELGV